MSSRALKLIEQAMPEGEPPVEGEAQAPDATDVAEQPVPEPSVTIEGEIYMAGVSASAFVYKPTDEEMNIVDTLMRTYGQTEPKRVIEKIEDLIQLSDKSLAQELRDTTV